MTSSENKVRLNSPVLDLHQCFVSRLSPSSHHHIHCAKAVATNAQDCHLCHPPASTQAQRSCTAGILQLPEATQGCRVKVSYCYPLPSQQQHLPHSAFHLLSSLLSANFPYKLFLCFFHTNFLCNKSTESSCFSLPFKPRVVTFHKRASSILLARSKQTATKHTTLAHLSLHTPFSLIKSCGFPSPFSCWNTVSS